MINNTNLIVLVGKKEFPEFSPKKISLWAKNSSNNNSFEETKQYFSNTIENKPILERLDENLSFENDNINLEDNNINNEESNNDNHSVKNNNLFKEDNENIEYNQNKIYESKIHIPSSHSSNERKCNKNTSNDSFFKMKDLKEMDNNKEIRLSGKIICTSNCFNEKISSVKANKQYLIVFVNEFMHIFLTNEMKNICSVNIGKITCCSLSAGKDINQTSYLAFSVSNQAGVLKLYNLVMLSLTNSVEAHDSTIRAIEINYDNNLIATCSEKGTLIRVFSLPELNKITTFRRGTLEANIYSLKFSFDNQILASTSNSGSIHLFKLNNSKESNINYCSNNSFSDEYTVIDDSELVKSEANNNTSKGLISSMFNNIYSNVSNKISTVSSNIIPKKYLDKLDYSRSYCSNKSDELKLFNKLGFSGLINDSSNLDVNGNGNYSLFSVNINGTCIKAKYTNNTNKIYIDKGVDLNNLNIIN